MGNFRDHPNNPHRGETDDQFSERINGEMREVLAQINKRIESGNLCLIETTLVFCYAMCNAMATLRTSQPVPPDIAELLEREEQSVLTWVKERIGMHDPHMLCVPGIALIVRSNVEDAQPAEPKTMH